MASWSAYPAEGTVPKGCGENRLKGEFTAKGLAEKQSCCPGPAMERVMPPGAGSATPVQFIQAGWAADGRLGFRDLGTE